jgi:O-antigen/teichoic acid export membrane protein
MKFTSFIKITITDMSKIMTSKEGLKSLYGVSLYRNAVYLMLNSSIFAITGFFFWIAAAKLYPAEAVGISSAAISAVGLLSMLSVLGLDYGLIRFLPGSGEKTNAMINSCFTIGGIVSIVFAIIFLAGIGVWSPALLPIRNNTWYFIAFVFFAMVATMQSFSGQSFVAVRKTGFSLIQGLIASILRFVPLVILPAYFETFGIFASWALAICVAVIISITLLLPRAHKGYRPVPSIRKDVVREMIRFSFANYVANILSTLPQLILPLMVVNLLSAEKNAYYYIGWSMVGIVFMVPQAASLSLLAEASHDEKQTRKELMRSLKMILLLLVPAIVILLLLGDKLLLFFGKNYAENATKLLWILAASALPLSLNYVYFTIKRVEKKMKSVIWLNAFITVATLGIAYFLLPRIGIIGAGLAWLISQSVVALWTLLYLGRRVFTNP